MDKVQNLQLDRGASFSLSNTTPGGLDVSITTEKGTVIKIALPPGGEVDLSPVFENLKLSALTGAPPGITGAV